jgi:hypothetical protein
MANRTLIEGEIHYMNHWPVGALSPATAVSAVAGSIEDVPIKSLDMILVITIA